MLRRIIKASHPQCKWPVIARSIPGRSGKQCRERYLNHLRPSLKLASWSPVEDACLYHLFRLEGSKWATIAKCLPGRSDNNIKNRYHHLKRRFEKQCSSISDVSEEEELALRLKACRLAHETSIERPVLKYLVHRARTMGSRLPLDGEYEFGPYRCVVVPEIACTRCGLWIPSRQTGRLVCETTGWCQTCTKFSPCINGNLIRSVQSLEKLIVIPTKGQMDSVMKQLKYGDANNDSLS